MKFNLLTAFEGESGEKADNALLESDYKAAREIGVLRLGETGLFFRAGFKKYFIPYSSINRAFRRVIAVPAKLCCGSGSLEIENLVVAKDDKELAQIQLPGTRAAEEVMRLLKEKMPEADFTAIHANPEEVRQGTVINDV